MAWGGPLFSLAEPSATAGDDEIVGAIVARLGRKEKGSRTFPQSSWKLNAVSETISQRIPR